VAVPKTPQNGEHHRNNSVVHIVVRFYLHTHTVIEHM